MDGSRPFTSKSSILPLERYQSIKAYYLSFFPLAGEVRFIDTGAQLRFEAINGKAGDSYANSSDRENPINSDGDQDSSTSLPPHNSSDLPLSPQACQGSSQIVEAVDASVSTFDDSTTVETQSSQKSSTPRSQWGVSRDISSPGALLLPERDLNRLQIAKQSPFSWIEAFDGSQCACLMLFFVEKLAPHVRYTLLPHITQVRL